MSAPFAKLPNWAEYGLIPLVNLVVSFAVAGLAADTRRGSREPQLT